MSRTEKQGIRRAVQVALPVAIMVAGCAPKPIHIAHARGVVKVINVVLDENKDGECVNDIGDPVKVEGVQQDSLLVRFDSKCATKIDLSITALNGLPVSCNGADAGVVSNVSVDPERQAYLDCRVAYSKPAYLIRLREIKRRRLGSELALEEVP